MLARRTTVRLVYEGKDISRDIAGDLLAFSWEDDAKGKVDSASLTLKNEHRLWSSDWLPSRGDEFEAWIVDGELQFRCGRFEVDELDFSFPTSTVTIKGLGVSASSPARRTSRSRAWEDVSLEDIARTLAEEGELALLYDVDTLHLFDRVDQSRETDLGFLARICEEIDCAVKVTDEALIVYEVTKYEDREPAWKAELGDPLVLSVSFNVQASELYKSARVTYLDPDTNTKIEAVVEDPHVTRGLEASVRRRARSVGHAEEIGRAELARLNRREVEANVTVRGQASIVSAAVIALEDFGALSGRYMIDSARHSVSASSGWTVSVDAHRVGD